MLGVVGKMYVIVLFLIVVLDLLWIGVVMKDFYRSQLGHLMSGGILWMPALFFYLIFAAGLLYFVIFPTANTGSLARTFLVGSAFGIVAYATYDLTNHATLRDWPFLLTAVDILWGACLSGIVSVLAVICAKVFEIGF